MRRRSPEPLDHPCKHLWYGFTGKPLCSQGYYGNFWRRWVTKRPICMRKGGCKQCRFYQPCSDQAAKHHTRNIKVGSDQFRPHSQPLAPPITDRALKKRRR